MKRSDVLLEEMMVFEARGKADSKGSKSQGTNETAMG